MIKRLIYFTCIAFLLSFSACEKGYLVDDSASGSNDNSTGVHEETADYTWNEEDVTNITFNGTSIITDGTGVSISGSIATITAAGTYRASGTLNDGQIIVNTQDKGAVRFILNSVTISCSSNAPLHVVKAEKFILVLAESTVNTLCDGNTYTSSGSTDEPTATVYSKSDMTIFGNGTLVVDANFQDGISGKDGLIMKSGIVKINAVDDGLCGKDYLIVKDGNIDIDSGGDGLKSDNTNNTDLGYVSVESGVINVVSAGDAISAESEVRISGGELTLNPGGGSSVSYLSVSAKGIKAVDSLTISNGTLVINSADDGLHSAGAVILTGGTITVASGDDGIHAGVSVSSSEADLSITKSYEGIESPSITVNSGKVSIVANDDAFNASKGNGGENDDSSLLSILGGNVFVNALTGDALDSNGSIEISGGTILVHGPQSNPEVGMDYNGTCKVIGGFLIISGTNSNMTQAPSSSSTQNCLKIMTNSSLSAGTIFHIGDASGNDIVTFAPLRNYSSIVFSSPDLKTGSTYYIYKGGTSTGTLSDGLYKNGTYTPGTLWTNFTISGVITTLGSGGSGPGG